MSEALAAEGVRKYHVHRSRDEPDRRRNVVARRPNASSSRASSTAATD